MLRLHGPIWTVMSINFENISLLVSGCMDLLANKKCAQVAWTYMITIVCSVAQTYKIAILCSGHMDLYDCHLCSGCMDLYNQHYDLHFTLRSHGHILHV